MLVLQRQNRWRLTHHLSHQCYMNTMGDPVDLIDRFLAERQAVHDIAFMLYNPKATCLEIITMHLLDRLQHVEGCITTGLPQRLKRYNRWYVYF